MIMKDENLSLNITPKGSLLPKPCKLKRNGRSKINCTKSCSIILMSIIFDQNDGRINQQVISLRENKSGDRCIPNMISFTERKSL